MAPPPTPPPAPEPQPAPAPKPGRSKLLVLGGVVGLVVLLLGAGGAWLVFARGHRDGGDKAPEKPAHIWKAGTIVVNVAGTEGRRYLRATVELGVDAKEVKQLEQRRAPLLDAAIEVLASKRLEQLLETNEREKLKDELKRQLNSAAGSTRISQVFLTEFVVQ